MTTASLITAVTSLESAANMVPVIYKQTLINYLWKLTHTIIAQAVKHTRINMGKHFFHINRLCEVPNT